MNNITFYIVNACIGMLVGAGTNELAIRWIFWKIIPKKRERMAEAVKDVMSKQIMAPDKIKQKIESPKVRDSLQHNIQSLTTQLLDSELPSLKELFKDKSDILDAVEKRLLSVISDKIFAKISQKDFYENTLQGFISNEMETLWAKSPNELFSELDSLLNAVPEKIKELLRKEENRSYLLDAVTGIVNPLLKSEKTLREFFPERIQADIVRVLMTQMPNLTEQFVLFMKREEVQQKLKDNIKQALDDQVSKRTPGVIKNVKSVFDSFLQRDTSNILTKAIGLDDEIDEFCQSLPERIRAKAEEDENKAEFEKLIQQLTTELLNTRINVIFSSMNQDNLKKGFETFYEQIFNDDTCLKIGSEVRSVMENACQKSLKDNVNSLHLPIKPQQLVDSIGERLCHSLQSDVFKNLVEKKLDDFCQTAMTRKIGRLNRWIKIDVQQPVAEIASTFLIETMTMRFEEFVEQSGFWDIVTTSLNSYSNKQIEILVRKIADRELRWITVMGGIIGLIVGLIQSVIIKFMV